MLPCHIYYYTDIENSQIKRKNTQRAIKNGGWR